MGGFGFGMLADVQMLGFYQAQHPQMQRAFLAYVLQVTTTNAQTFLIYRRYSQIAALATRLHFHPSVGLPPKYALQVFPLTEDQLRLRFEGLQTFIAEIFAYLSKQHDEGMQHDVNSTAGLDMQIFYDFISHQRNRPPAAVKTLPDWAKPRVLHGILTSAISSMGPDDGGDSNQYPPTMSRASSFDSVDQFEDPHRGRSMTWQDIDSMDSSEVGIIDDQGDGSSKSTGSGGEHMSNQFRNEILQAEGNLNALWNCVKAYEKATGSWFAALGAVADEYKRVTDMALFKVARKTDGSTERLDNSGLPVPPSHFVAAHNHVTKEMQPEFERKCRVDVLDPLERLIRDLLPEVKHSYWTRLANMQQQASESGSSSFAPDNFNVRRLLQEREMLHDKIRGDVQVSISTFVRLQADLLELVRTQMTESAGLETVDEGTEAIEGEVECDVELSEEIAESAVREEPVAVGPTVVTITEIMEASRGSFDNEEFKTDDEEVSESAHVWVWGRPPKSESGAPLILRPKETPILPGQAILQIACGGEHLLYLTESGDVYTFGDEDEKKSSSGSSPTHQPSLSAPRLIEEFALEKALHQTKIVSVSCGAQHSLGITEAGELYTWGSGEDGRLGHGDMRDRSVPRKVMSLLRQRVVQASCGGAHTAVLTDKGHTVNKDTPERIDCFQPTKDLVIGCGHKYTIAVEVDPAYLSHASTVVPVKVSANARGLPPTLTINVHDLATPPSRGKMRTPTNLLTPGSAKDFWETRDTIHDKEEELRKAKKMWRTRILRDWEESKDTPLAHTMWRQGIPPSIRARVWPLAIGNKLKITPNMYQIYRKRAIDYKQERSGGSRNGGVIGKEHTLALIDTDLPRTFPSLRLFDATGPYYEFLLEVLETYACYRPDLGYIQGMSYLAALLCLHMPQDRYLAFQCLANLMVNEHLFTFYLLDAELSEVYYKLFDEFLATRLPDLHHHMKSIGVSCSMYLMNWLQTLFLQVLPLEVAARVVDNFLLDGTVFLFRAAMAIHELLRGDLLGTDMDEAIPIIQRNHLYQDLWLTRVTEEDLFGTIAEIAVPTHVYSALDRVVNDVFFFEKRRNRSELSSRDLVAAASGGQSVGIGRVKNERRRMYSISDTLNGVLGGF
ncbi:hypothetical protein Poli38472_010745 [Pythium oligandrum]|uniref:Rab-GAP TBC domain-containing protein n=1 Tax=Pythium oligandrum TaxID=41045 RepID=A0A8K1FJD3_PYTOL|nr:hypothetical protein Poli38472_010745 [Pythium oligandrum]|eukprot:TMW61682.1 hypothetical protein Poli38472_010745 [Pythium oligandrum]